MVVDAPDEEVVVGHGLAIWSRETYFSMMVISSYLCTEVDEENGVTVAGNDVAVSDTVDVRV